MIPRDAIYCKDNAGFEDKITADQWYAVINLKNNSIMIKDDNNDYTWLGQDKFDLVTLLNGAYTV